MELADIFRAHGSAYGADHRLSAVQCRAMRAIVACRTAALGGHLEACDTCGEPRYTYHSCRNRHCPKCQTRAKERWLEARQRELLRRRRIFMWCSPSRINSMRFLKATRV